MCAKIQFNSIQFSKSIDCCGPVYAGTLVTNEVVAIKELAAPDIVDVYGLGGVLFAMITKSEPWKGLSTLQICGKSATGHELAAIVRRCMQIDPQQRCSLS